MSEKISHDNIDDENRIDFIDFDALLGAVRRQWLVVAVCVACAALIGFAVATTSVPLYTASAKVLMDRDANQVVQQLSVIGGVMDDEASVLSQVELLQSETIGLAVVDKLDLSNDPQFMARQSSLFGSVVRFIKSVVSVSQWFSSGKDDSVAAEAKRRAALGRVVGNVDVSRVGRTYVLEIKYTSPSPELAARVANTIASEYLVDKLNSKYDATRRASVWLQDRIDELRRKAMETDLAVQKFKSANGLVTAGNSLVSDQQLSELNSAMIVAQSDSAKAEAKLDGIQKVISAGQSDAIVTDALDSSVVNELRKKYLASSKLESEISSRLGAQHIQAVRLRKEMDEYRRLMFEELGRIAESYKSDLAIAKARETSLQNSVSLATGVSAVANETQVQLRELEREAETYKNLYQTFLQRYQQAVQQQSFPVTDARVISSATAPDSPSQPRKLLVLAAFCFVGAGIGAGIGAFREFRDRFFRTGEQVRDILGLEFLGIAPLMNDGLRVVDNATESNPRSIRKATEVTNYVIDHPLSSFAETLRSAKIAADLGVSEKECKVIGIISTLPGEGKSTVSVNFAELLASQGSRVILIDADLRNPGATRAIGRHAQEGLLETLLEGKNPKDCFLYNARTGMAFLPAVVKHRVPHSSELLSSVAMRKLLSTLSASADYIIIDLPPLGPVVDARAMASRIDGFVYVAEWGKTARRVVRQTLETEPLIRQKCLGVILNKVDQEKMNLYRSYGSTEYYYSRYSEYYQEKT
ncbi:polysaccharide biosynthesis tyrosine autokinase [Agrobacterium sp. AGB01]|uniref:polysaccharide biosynthesis tyrosine autokinase n=1 Tax=Agrobacterium sp. AGB01 TaxID=2769302 RepID=UPI00352FFB7D